MNVKLDAQSLHWEMAAASLEPLPCKAHKRSAIPGVSTSRQTAPHKSKSAGSTAGGGTLAVDVDVGVDGAGDGLRASSLPQLEITRAATIPYQRLGMRPVYSRPVASLQRFQIDG